MPRRGGRTTSTPSSGPWWTSTGRSAGSARRASSSPSTACSPTTATGERRRPTSRSDSTGTCAGARATVPSGTRPGPSASTWRTRGRRGRAGRRAGSAPSGTRARRTAMRPTGRRRSATKSCARPRGTKSHPSRRCSRPSTPRAGGARRTTCSPRSCCPSPSSPSETTKLRKRRRSGRRIGRSPWRWWTFPSTTGGCGSSPARWRSCSTCFENSTRTGEESRWSWATRRWASRRGSSAPATPGWSTPPGASAPCTRSWRPIHTSSSVRAPA
mmetsp:Transcript_29480/g.62607  ORF Transcript_29480/g.62607 Transcript_29480/m.62607 type:complete len:271 (+) Transcript_29480:151-963(+)